MAAAGVEAVLTAARAYKAKATPYQRSAVVSNTYCGRVNQEACPELQGRAEESDSGHDLVSELLKLLELSGVKRWEGGGGVAVCAAQLDGLSHFQGQFQLQAAVVSSGARREAAPKSASGYAPAPDASARLPGAVEQQRDGAVDSGGGIEPLRPLKLQRIQAHAGVPAHTSL